MWAVDGHAQSASGESFYVAVQVAVGPNRPLSPRGRAAQVNRWLGQRRGKNEVDLIHRGLWQVCFYVFVFSPVYLNPSLLDRRRRRRQGGSPWWHCQMTASVRRSRPLHPYYLDNLLKSYFERKLGRLKSCPITPLVPVQLGTLHNCFWLLDPGRRQFSQKCRIDSLAT